MIASSNEKVVFFPRLNVLFASLEHIKVLLTNQVASFVVCNCEEYSKLRSLKYVDI